jgi:hypothetical protein
MNSLSINEMKAFIKQMKRNGDIISVCAELGCSPQVFWNAMYRAGDNYTDMEIRVIQRLYHRVSERAELRRSVGLTPAGTGFSAPTNLPTAKTPGTAPEHISGTREAALFLSASGYAISLSQLAKETARGTVPCRRFGKRLLFGKQELVAWAEARCRPMVITGEAASPQLSRRKSKKPAQP